MKEIIENRGILFESTSNNHQAILTEYENLANDKLESFTNGISTHNLRHFLPFWDKLDVQENNDNLIFADFMDNLSSDDYTVVSIGGFDMPAGEDDYSYTTLQQGNADYKRYFLPLKTNNDSGVVFTTKFESTITKKKYPWQLGKWSKISNDKNTYEFYNHGDTNIVVIIMDIFEGTATNETIKSYYKDLESLHQFSDNVKSKYETL